MWGKGKRSEVALQHLQRERFNGGKDWSNLRCHVLAAKLVDIRDAMRSNDVLTKIKIENAIKTKTSLLKQFELELKPFSLSMKVWEDSLILEGKRKSLIINGSIGHKALSALISNYY